MVAARLFPARWLAIRIWLEGQKLEEKQPRTGAVTGWQTLNQLTGDWAANSPPHPALVLRSS